MRIVAIFDPTNPAAAFATSFNTAFANKTGRIVVHNESNLNIKLGWNSFTTYCPAWTSMLYCIQAPTTAVAWSVISTITAVNVPISQVLVEAYDPGEVIVGTYPSPISRMTVHGNSVNQQQKLLIFSNVNMNGGGLTPGMNAGQIMYLVALDITVSAAAAAAHGVFTVTGIDPIIDPFTLGLSFVLSTGTAQLTPPISRDFITPIPSIAGHGLTFTGPTLSTAVVVLNIYYYVV
jgi:hypothetical protein